MIFNSSKQILNTDVSKQKTNKMRLRKKTYMQEAVTTLPYRTHAYNAWTEMLKNIYILLKKLCKMIDFAQVPQQEPQIRPSIHLFWSFFALPQRKHEIHQPPNLISSQEKQAFITGRKQWQRRNCQNKIRKLLKSTSSFSNYLSLLTWSRLVHKLIPQGIPKGVPHHLDRFRAMSHQETPFALPIIYLFKCKEPCFVKVNFPVDFVKNITIQKESGQPDR